MVYPADSRNIKFPDAKSPRPIGNETLRLPRKRVAVDEGRSVRVQSGRISGRTPHILRSFPDPGMIAALGRPFAEQKWGEEPEELN
jgi:hypothetical protein